MRIEDKKIYSEVYSVLNLLGEKYINKLPSKLVEFIKNNRLKSYNPAYTFSKELDVQNIEKDSLALITMINYKYWLETEDEKEELFKLLKNN